MRLTLGPLSVLLGQRDREDDTSCQQLPSFLQVELQVELLPKTKLRLDLSLGVCMANTRKTECTKTVVSIHQDKSLLFLQQCGIFLFQCYCGVVLGFVSGFACSLMKRHICIGFNIGTADYPFTCQAGIRIKYNT